MGDAAQAERLYREAIDTELAAYGREILSSYMFE